MSFFNTTRGKHDVGRFILVLLAWKIDLELFPRRDSRSGQYVTLEIPEKTHALGW
jgi:hypothetical protein